MEKFEYNLPKFKLKKPGKKSRIVFYIIATLIGIFILYQIAIFFINYPIYSALSNTQNFSPAQIGKSQDLAKIDNVFELPKDQNGKIAVIKDVNALSQKNPAFKRVRNGDVIIIYPDMYIVYDRENHYVADIARTKLLQ
jgi:hypothetical protein